MAAVINLFQYLSLASCLTLTMAGNKTENASPDLKPMITSGYRMHSSILAQHVVSVRLLQVIKFFGDNHFCGGTIISTRKIVTAAHCVRTPWGLAPPTALTVVAGSLLRLTPTGDEKFYNVSEAITHPNYRNQPVYADIAILVLSQHLVEIADTIKIAKLATKTPIAGTNCTALGWGQLFQHGPQPDEILYVDLNIWPRDECVSIHHDMQNGIFCAGDYNDRGKGSCHGDSGGPLFCNGNLAGIVSYGAGCGWHEGAADFYIDVAYFLNWINNRASKF